MKGLRGTEFTYVNSRGNTKAFVAQAKIGEGLTVKDIESNDPDAYLYCFNEKGSPGNDPARWGYFDALNLFIDMILTGTVDVNKFEEATFSANSNAVCAF
jgi:hypothetical protein